VKSAESKQPDARIWTRRNFAMLFMPGGIPLDEYLIRGRNNPLFDKFNAKRNWHFLESPALIAGWICLILYLIIDIRVVSFAFGLMAIFLFLMSASVLAWFLDLLSNDDTPTMPKSISEYVRRPQRYKQFTKDLGLTSQTGEDLAAVIYAEQVKRPRLTEVPEVWYPIVASFLALLFMPWDIVLFLITICFVIVMIAFSVFLAKRVGIRHQALNYVQRKGFTVLERYDFGVEDAEREEVYTSPEEKKRNIILAVAICGMLLLFGAIGPIITPVIEELLPVALGRTIIYTVLLVSACLLLLHVGLWRVHTLDAKVKETFSRTNESYHKWRDKRFAEIVFHGDR